MDGASIAQRVFDRCRSGIVCRHHRLGFRSGTRADRRWCKSSKTSGSGLMSSRVLFPDGWAPPIGYANGIETTPGKMVFVAGQVGWDANQKFTSEELVPQFEQAIRNVLQVLAVAGGRPDHICRITAYCTDKHAYLDGRQELGKIWRILRVGQNLEMTVIFVVDLLDHYPKIEL